MHARGRCRQGVARGGSAAVLIVSALAALASFAALAPAAHGQSPVRTELPVFLTPTERTALQARLGAMTLTVRRTLPPPVGVIAPSPDVRLGLGICVGPGRVLTALGPVADWPMPKRAAEDRVEVESPDGLRRPAAVGHVDPDLGIAVLDVPGLGASPCLPAGLSGPGDGDVGLGVLLFAAVPGSNTLAETAVRGPGQGVSAWFVLADGEALPPGTPLFSGRGTFMTLVGAADPALPGRSWLLPARAVRLLFEERFRWGE